MNVGLTRRFEFDLEARLRTRVLDEHDGELLVDHPRSGDLG